MILPRGLLGYYCLENSRSSTQPASPLARIRRHAPRISPSCTREFGPTDATIRAPLLASARTTTQSREIELTHRVEVRNGGAAEADDVAGGLPPGFEDATERGAGPAVIERVAATLIVSCVLALSGATLPALAKVVREAAESVLISVTPEATVSLASDADSGRVCAITGAGLASFDA